MKAALLLAALAPFAFADPAGDAAQTVVEDALRRVAEIHPPVAPPHPGGRGEAKSSREFLARLSDPSTLAPLKSRRAFKSFLRRRKVPRRLIPGFLMLHRLMENAADSDFKELAHILPTAVSFLQDGHAVILDKRSHSYYGVTLVGAGFSAEITLSGKTAKLHPLLRAKTLAHEFQHVYDQSVSRVQPLGAMEARGQKVAILVLALAKERRPEEYARLRRSRSYEAREIIKDSEYCMTALQEGAHAFMRAVGFGQCRRRIPESMALERYSLSSVLDPDSGAPGHLEALRAARRRTEELIAELLEARDSGGKTEQELEWLDSDLVKAKEQASELERQVLIKKDLIRRVTKELAWLKGKDGPGAVYDLHLQVDEPFLEPALSGGR